MVEPMLNPRRRLACRHRRLVWSWLAAMFVLLAGAAPGLAATRPLTTGFTDSVFQQEPRESDVWLDRANEAGARVVLLSLSWRATAATRPADAEDPRDPAYDWDATDIAVRNADAHGLRVAMTVIYAPAWAEGPGRPADAVAGTWRPSARAFGRFVTAAARRYSGRFVAGDGPLPRIRDWQAWSEPNLDNHISPQWTRKRGRSVPASPGIYRGLLNAAYRAVKGVSRSNRVITGATAPFGDLTPSGGRIPPARFVRELLCLKGRQKLRRKPCPNRARFDILAHHPYSVGPPSRRALNRDDVSLPDLGKLTRVLRAAERERRVLPRGRKRLWVTEFAYDSSPPDPLGVPSARHARWTQDALYLMWRQGVDTVMWYNIRDQAPRPSFASTYQSGLFLREGQPKPALRAFRFPFVTQRISGGRVRIWTKSPAKGRLLIERRGSDGKWRTVARRSVRRGETVVLQRRIRGAARLRARVGDDRSISRRQR